MKLSPSFLALALAIFPTAFAVPEPQDVSASGLKDLLNLIPKPKVKSELLQALILEPNLMGHARQFYKFATDNGGHRAFGSGGHNATVNYIKKKLEATGYYDVELQSFPYLFSEGSATLAVDGQDLTTFWFTYGPAGDVEAPLVPVNNLGCEASDYPAAVAGQIALIKRGTCEFGHKVALAGAAGAAGAIIFNNAPEALGSATLGAVSRPDVGPYVPMASLSGVDGERICDEILAGATRIAKLHVDATTENRVSSNVLATTKGGDKNNIVFAGGHSDSVPAGPGINDDGSGTMGLLEVALNLRWFSVKNAVRFGFWTAEEFGLVGSEHYVTNLSEAERQKIAVYLNFDMIASPNYGFFIYNGDGTHFPEIGAGPPGSEHIEAVFKNWYTKNKLKHAPTEFSGRSDYGPFLDVGIPSGGLFTGAEGVKTAEEAVLFGGQAGVAYDVCYHKDCDTMANLNKKAWVANTRAAAHSIAHYATSLEGIPRTRATGGNARVAKLNFEERRHQACGHEIAFA